MVLEYKKNYQEYKADLAAELVTAAESFVRIGYLLKVARDTDILMESGYESVVDFAKAEFGIDKTQVSRFININDRFSENGYSDHLQEHYRGFGYAKLSIMLMLPEAITEEITADYSKAEIQAIKEEVDEEKKVSDIEIMIEASQTAPESDAAESHENMDLYMTIKRLGEEEPKLYAEMWKEMRRQTWSMEILQERMAPEGQKLYSIRIPGIGRKQLILKGTDNGNEVVLVDLRSAGKQHYTWQDIMTVWQDITKGGEGYIEAWEELHMTSWPKEEVAPVQQQTAPTNAPVPAKPTTKKESKVSKAKPTPKKPIEPKPAAVAESQEEDQLPGQTSIEKDFPEYMPGPVAEPEEQPMAPQGPVEEAEDTEAEQNPQEMENVTEIAEIMAPKLTYEQEVAIWNEIDKNEDIVADVIVDWRGYNLKDIPKDQLEKAYKSAINVAAGFEKLLGMFPVEVPET